MNVSNREIMQSQTIAMTPCPTVPRDTLDDLMQAIDPGNSRLVITFVDDLYLAVAWIYRPHSSSGSQGRLHNPDQESQGLFSEHAFATVSRALYLKASSRPS